MFPPLNTHIILLFLTEQKSTGLWHLSCNFSGWIDYRRATELEIRLRCSLVSITASHCPVQVRERLRLSVWNEGHAWPSNTEKYNRHVEPEDLYILAGWCGISSEEREWMYDVILNNNVAENKYSFLKYWLIINHFVVAPANLTIEIIIRLYRVTWLIFTWLIYECVHKFHAYTLNCLHGAQSFW
jgi:hypothetical protein